jgi:hypothetical protein
MRFWAIGLALAGWTGAHADTLIKFPNFADVASLTFAGDATGPVTVKQQSVLQLVPQLTYQSGAAYLTTPITLGPRGEFATSFQFRVTGSNAAYWSDGMSDKLPNEVAVTTNGNTSTIENPSGSAGTPYGVTQCEGNGPGQAGCLNDGKLWSAMITYDGTYMNVTVQDGNAAQVQVITNYKLDLRKALQTATVYAGFTAGTGEGYADFDVYNWSLRY